MTVTLIVPIYNEGSFLPRCLDSIEKQSSMIDEVLLIDDGSTDLSAMVARDYCERNQNWHLIRLGKNNGVSAARNKGMEFAGSDWITFLDADDELAPGAIGTMQKAVEKYPDENIFQFNNLVYFSPFGSSVTTNNNRFGHYDIRHIHNNASATCLNTKKWCMVWNKLYRKNIILMNGARFKVGLQYGEDEHFNLQLLLAGVRVLNIDAATIIRHKDNQSSLSHIKTIETLEHQDHELRELLHRHCGVKEPWQNITGIIRTLDEHHNSPTYEAAGWREKHEA